MIDQSQGISGGPGFMGERYANYLGERAKGGAGLIICGQTAVHPSTAWEQDMSNIMISYDERAIPGFKLVTDTIHNYGATAFLQLFHSGIVSSTVNSDLVALSPSTLLNPWGELSKAMEIEDIEELIEYYGKCAQNGKDGGFDGIEIHSTHGYLPQQFLSPLSNKRTDDYGGSLDNRMRFLLRAIDRIKEVIGDRMALGVRLCGDDLTPGGISPDLAREVAVKLEATGKVDYISVSIGSILTGAHWVTPPMYIPSGSAVYASAAVREAVDHIPIFVAGRIIDPLHAEKILAEGHADMVGMTRALIADPEVAKKAQEGKLEDIRNCLGCVQRCGGLSTEYTIPISCTQNPAVGKEKEWGIGKIQHVAKGKKILIAGGGPGGMESAWVAASRGHRVTLYEKTDRLGGQINIASKLLGRDEMEGIIRWRIKQMSGHNIKVVLGQEVTSELVATEKPDAVIVATGSKPILRSINSYTPIQGLEENNVVLCEDILEGRANVGNKVIVLDIQGRIKGLGIADMLALQGKAVELITPLFNPGAYVELFNLLFLLGRMRENGVKFTPNSYLQKISGKTVTIVDLLSRSERTEEGIDTIIIATHGTPNDELYFALKGKVPELHRIGDCLVPRMADRAIHDGHRVGLLL
jgi:mycofactocin system FadH/OYE family oxidoreductase 2